MHGQNHIKFTSVYFVSYCLSVSQHIARGPYFIFPFLGAFAKLGRAIISFAMSSVRPSVRLSAWNNSAPTRQIFMKCLCEYFSKICRENSSFTKIWQKRRVLYMKTTRYFWSYLAQFFLDWQKIQTKICRGNQNVQFVFINYFVSKILPFWDNVEKYCWTVQATDDSMAHAHCMLDT